MDLPIEFHPESAAEAAAARAWYGQRSAKAAAGFLAELDVACQRIVEAPNRYPAHVAGTRRYLMRQFPFHVIYRVPSDPDMASQIMAVAHGHRRPGYWKERST